MSRKRSNIWMHFSIKCKDKAECNVCKSNISYKAGSTNNLHRHLKSQHQWIQLSEVVRRPSDDGQAIPSVEVILENGDSDTLTMVNEDQINSAINGILEAVKVGPEEQATHVEESNDLPVKRRRNKRSLIWKHYEQLPGLNAVRCCICMKKIQCSVGSGTSNLHRHMSKRHPEVFSQLVGDGQHPPPPSSSKGSDANDDASTPPEAVGVKEDHRPFSDALKVSRTHEGEKRVFRRERDLIEGLRRAQREEAHALELQRELLEKLRALNAREAAAEREQIESLRKAQLEEAEDLSRQRDEVQKEKTELQKKWEELQQERDLVLFSREQQDS